MATFTSSLPDELLERLSEIAKDLKVPKNRLIQKALEIYLDEVKRARYIKSFQRASRDKEIMDIAEEGMEDYLKQLKEYD